MSEFGLRNDFFAKRGRRWRERKRGKDGQCTWFPRSDIPWLIFLWSRLSRLQVKLWLMNFSPCVLCVWMFHFLFLTCILTLINSEFIRDFKEGGKEQRNERRKEQTNEKWIFIWNETLSLQHTNPNTCLSFFHSFLLSVSSFRLLNFSKSANVCGKEPWSWWVYFIPSDDY